MSTFFKHIYSNGSEKTGGMEDGIKIEKPLSVDESDFYYNTTEYNPYNLVPENERTSQEI